MQKEGKGWVAWLILLGESLCEKTGDPSEVVAGGRLELVQMWGQGGVVEEYQKQ